jgi:hypothetical protein
MGIERRVSGIVECVSSSRCGRFAGTIVRGSSDVESRRGGAAPSTGAAAGRTSVGTKNLGTIYR